MCATQARTSARSLVSGVVVGRLDLRRLLEQRVHQLPEDLEQQPLLGADVVVEPAAAQAGRLAQLVHVVAWKPRRANSAAAVVDDLLLAAVVALAERGDVGAGHGFVTSVRYKYGMDFDLPDDHELIRRTVRDFAEEEVAPVAEELDRTKAFPYAIVKQLGELGLMGIPFPEEYGGGGGDSLAYAIAVEELTRVDSSVAITLCAHTSLGTQPIYLFGTEEQKQEWMPRLTSGEILGAFGLTEPEAGSDAGNVRTRAALDDGEWTINGTKQFITNAGTDISGVVCITARPATTRSPT